MNSTNCPDCKGDLEQGVLLDYTYGGLLVERYAKTEIPTTTKNLLIGMYEANFNDVRRVIARRCTKCNRILLYAQDIVLTPNLNSTNNKNIFITIGVVILILVIVGIVSVLLGNQY